MSRFNPRIHHRRSIRLPTWDYAQAGAYFLTLCTQSKQCLFGEIAEGEMRLNEPGQMVWKWWNELPRKYPGVHLDSAVVMPNHLHGIIIIQQDDTKPVGAALRGRPQPGQTPDPPVGAALCGRPKPGQTRRSAPTVGDMVRWFKTMTTNEYIRGVKSLGWTEFPGRVWQRNYFEHVIRGEEDHSRIQEYILQNPLRWPDDEENPARTSGSGCPLSRA